MNKKLIAIAVAAGLAPMAAQAEPTVYGMGQVEFGSHGGKNTNGTDRKGHSMDDNARGRIGIKNAEDLGNGMTALFKAEFKTDFADGDSGVAEDDKDTTKNQGVALQKREMMVGIKAGFGQIEAGRLKSPYKYTGGVKYDPFVTTYHEARGVVASGKVGKGNGYGNNGFISDALSYQNKFGPIKVWALRVMDNGGPSTDKGGNGLVWAVAYEQGNIEAHIKAADDDQDKGGYAATALGAKMKFGNMDLAVEIESMESDNNKDGDSSDKGEGTDTMFINWNMKMGSNVITANYGVATTDTATETETTKLTLGVTHKFSKKTRAFVAHSITEQGASKKEERTVTSLGLRVDI